MKPRKQLGVTYLLLRRSGLWAIDSRSPTETTRLELPQVGRLRWSSAEFTGYTRHRHGSIRRVGLRARNGPGEHSGPPRRGRCPEKEQKASPAQMWVPTRRLENRRQGTNSSLSESSSGSASGTGCPPRTPDL
jgi:hypothetical protein